MGMTDAEYRLVDATTLSLDDLDRLQQVYQDGFPPERHKPWADVYDARLDNEIPLAVLDPSGRPVGFAFLRSLGQTDRMFLRFLAIATAERGRGVGAVAWQRLVAHCAGSGYRLLVWDVEHPDTEGIEPAQLTIRTRRIEFYRRLGGMVLPVDDYTNPHDGPDGPVEVPMLLMATGLDGTALPADLHWVDAVRRDVERFRWGR